MIDAAALRRDLAQLVAFPSVGGSAAEAEIQRWCAATLRELSLDVDRWRLDLGALRSDPDYPGEEAQRSEAWGVVGTAGDGVPELILCGHVDVVPAGARAGWSGGGPWALRADGDRFYGRGVCDMKGGLAAILAAVRAVADRLSRPFAVHTVVAEEDGGLGAFATLRRGHLGRRCLIAEPTAGQVIAANAGSLTFRLEVCGRATHGATAGDGVSALHVFERVHAALRELDASRNATPPAPFGARPFPISIGIVRAGEWASTVPDLLVAEGRYGVMPGESFAAAIAAFEAAVAAADHPWLVEHPVAVSWPGGRFAAGALPADDPFCGAVRGAVARVDGRAPQIVGAPYGSDLRHYTAAGIATVQYGPGRIRDAHAVDECVLIDDVIGCARVYAELLLDHCR